MRLSELTDKELDAILGMQAESRIQYFAVMTKNYFPKTVIESDEYYDIIETYISCFFLEKLFRTNRFFNEKFTPVYTDKGLIRNVVADLYFSSDQLATH